MPTLPNFTQFNGNYWDTASIRSALDYQGAIAPHTGDPYDEAMLLGISGGIAFGYFTFHYKGYDPQVNLLTRNTFDPMQRVFDRLGIEVKQARTASPDRAANNIVKAIESGKAPIIRPDIYSLDYYGFPPDDMTWGCMPMVCFGFDPDGDAMLADRSRLPWTVSAAELIKAMGRVKKDRYGLMLLGEPDNDLLPAAIRAGLRDTVRLMLEKPPKGAARNFGIKALQHWQDMLKGSGKGSWKREYGAGAAMMAAHTSAYTFLTPAFGKTFHADRDLYADFLRQAAVVLEEDALNDVAAHYDDAAKAWEAVIRDLLPGSMSHFKRAAQAIDGAAMSLREQDADKHGVISDRRHDLANLVKAANDDFPYSEAELDAVREQLRKRVMTAQAAENRAVLALKEVCATMPD